MPLPTLAELQEVAVQFETSTEFSAWLNENYTAAERRQIVTMFRGAGYTGQPTRHFWRTAYAQARLQVVRSTVTRTNGLLGNTIRVNQRRLQKAIKQLERNIIDAASELATERGRLVSVQANLKVLQRIHSRLTCLFDEEYGEGVRRSISGFDAILTNISQNFRDLNVVMEFTSVDRDIIASLRQTTFNNFAAYGEAAQQRLVTEMYNQVVAGNKMSTLTNIITGIFTGHVDVRGRPMVTYANQYAFDSVMNFHNTVNNKKAEDTGLIHFLYMGDIIKTSRPFCIRRAGRMYTKEEIESWDTMPWAGKSGPAFTHRGGYNCRHHWVGVRPEWVPEEGVDVQTYEGFVGPRDRQR